MKRAIKAKIICWAYGDNLFRRVIPVHYKIDAESGNQTFKRTSKFKLSNVIKIFFKPQLTTNLHYCSEDCRNISRNLQLDSPK